MTKTSKKQTATPADVAASLLKLGQKLVEKISSIDELVVAEKTGMAVDRIQQIVSDFSQVTQDEIEKLKAAFWDQSKDTARPFPMHFAKALGMTVKLKRHMFDKTQKALAKEAGLSVKRLRAIEQGKILPSRAEYDALKKAMPLRSYLKKSTND